jgi:hypothetical protein
MIHYKHFEGEHAYGQAQEFAKHHKEGATLIVEDWDHVQRIIQQMDSHYVKLEGDKENLSALLFEVIQRMDEMDTLMVKRTPNGIVIGYKDTPE